MHVHNARVKGDSVMSVYKGATINLLEIGNVYRPKIPLRLISGKKSNDPENPNNGGRGDANVRVEPV